ncbi:hypothetical protein K505DRAFT_130134 [Melanomma pulvis-pyrius CBS 109.77]|uniref:Uncharacterized protein n=1 Tax=Melanomma pulvis-pyrius CBS 109.77 TaxID=1314802 RepID=A0A6A6WTT8_9PLEO|nr:hypothetical protein K505DRAFT_130134 [Melanomma pulvis-pyrius CBS 109.77]
MLPHQASPPADRIVRICTALTNGPQGNNDPDHQPFTTLLLQLGGKSEDLRSGGDRSSCAFWSLRSLLARFSNPVFTGENARQHINMGLSYRAATKPAGYSFQHVQLLERPYWRASSTRLHILRCLLRSAAALNYSIPRQRHMSPPSPSPFHFLQATHSPLLLFIPRHP